MRSKTKYKIVIAPKGQKTDRFGLAMTLSEKRVKLYKSNNCYGRKGTRRAIRKFIATYYPDFSLRSCVSCSDIVYL